jgi:hypothetical protein
MQTVNLTGAALDWAVTKCELPKGWSDAEIILGDETDYSTNWALGGAIIEREWINIVKNESGKYWQAASEKWMLNDGHPCIGETPLIAAMRCYVESQLGDDVEVPEELL